MGVAYLKYGMKPILAETHELVQLLESVSLPTNTLSLPLFTTADTRAFSILANISGVRSFNRSSLSSSSFSKLTNNLSQTLSPEPTPYRHKQQQKNSGTESYCLFECYKCELQKLVNKQKLKQRHCTSFPQRATWTHLTFLNRVRKDN